MRGLAACLVLALGPACHYLYGSQTQIDASQVDEFDAGRADASDVIDAMGSPDADPSCACLGSDLMCTSGPIVCNFGCIGSVPSMCARFTPSNSIPVTNLATTGFGNVGAFATTADAVIDTNSAAQIWPGISLGAKVGVSIQNNKFFIIAADSVRISHRLTFRGDRIPVFLVRSDVSIEQTGTIDLSATSTHAGPGGYLHGKDTACGVGESPAAGTVLGGGGGAFVQEGGAGSASAERRAACALQLRSNLIGGSGGGDGSQIGGNGGGAIQISAFGTINIRGGLLAHGSGGTTSNSQDTPGAGGGGSGGAILLEATEIILGATARIWANGGAGGTIDALTTRVGGQNSNQPAVNGNFGGSGGVDTSQPGDGSCATGVRGLICGGGGGSVGSLLLRTKNAMVHDAVNSASSPIPAIVGL